MLIILTAVEKVAIHFGKPEQQWLDTITAGPGRGSTAAEGHFAPGSMLPKVQAAMAVRRAPSPAARALITLLEKARDGIEGRTGTVITNG